MCARKANESGVLTVFMLAMIAASLLCTCLVLYIILPRGAFLAKTSAEKMGGGDRRKNEHMGPLNGFITNSNFQQLLEMFLDTIG